MRVASPHEVTALEMLAVELEMARAVSVAPKMPPPPGAPPVAVDFRACVGFAEAVVDTIVER